MTAQKQQSFATELWTSDPTQTSPAPGAALNDWLLEPGLLTARMRAQCGRGFRLEVVNETVGGNGVAGELQRQVILWCNQIPCVYAETFIPAATASAHNWLLQLGAEPLGEKLQTRTDVRRGPFSYAVTDAGRLPAGLQDVAPATLYSRRSSFFIGAHELSVTEIFFPGIIGCNANPDTLTK